MLNHFESELIIKSPGRVNLIGEHIDYNGGYVLPGAIDKTIEFHFKKNDTEKLCHIYSANYDVSFDLNLKELNPSNTEWENYILGVLHEINLLKPNAIKGFDCVIKSNLPIGSGISSSAALECGLAKGMNLLFNLGLSDLEIIKLSRDAEHNFVGTKCGIMDQFAVVKGKKDNLIQLNCQTLDYKFIKANFAPYHILLLNTNKSHNLASSEYNTRREECEYALSTIKKNHPEYDYLVDVPEETLEKYNDILPEKVYNRALYVIQENIRTINAALAINNEDLDTFGNYLYQSHNGLQQLYEVSSDELDFLVDFSKSYDYVIGSRMMGGGFGGCTINLVHQNHIDDYIERASAAYKKHFSISLTPIKVTLSDGVFNTKQ